MEMESFTSSTLRFLPFFLLGVPWLVASPARAGLRQKYSIKDTERNDCLAHLCCCCGCYGCALAQETREIRYRKLMCRDFTRDTLFLDQYEIEGQNQDNNPYHEHGGMEGTGGADASGNKINGISGVVEYL
eukprot:TRINITY_DN2933_c0_g1_i1.p1 TRINITY_DN2933_c0_g1~~TRINITY_DN2933_c0_g1_i1.p1  ORF type:complete len:131 (-),score=21.07 TRINITY_DN2933_c0_g1_i1:16-408(-)